MSTYQTTGIILKKTDRGDYDQLFIIYTLSQGKVSALGRSTKKIKSKLNPSLHYFATLDLMIAPGKNYDHVAAVEIAKRFSNISSDLKKIILASYALELVDKLTRFGESENRIYNLLEKYLEALDENEFSDKDWQIIKQAFAVKLLAILGLEPPAEAITSNEKFEKFLEQQLDEPLQTSKFIIRFNH